MSVKLACKNMRLTATVLACAAASAAALTAPPQLQASVLQSVAAAFALSNRQSVALRRVVRAADEREGPSGLCIARVGDR